MKQIWATVGLKNDFLTGQEITENERQLAIASIGIPQSQLKNGSLVRIDISNPRSAGLRVPSGNEAGANSQWIPEGKLLMVV